MDGRERRSSRRSRWWCDERHADLRRRAAGAGRGRRAGAGGHRREPGGDPQPAAEAGRAFHRRRHLRADDDRHVGGPGAARPRARGARAGDVPDAARVRVHPRRRRHREAAGEAGRLRAGVPVGRQRAHAPGGRRHRGDARHPGHAHRLPVGQRRALRRAAGDRRVAGAHVRPLQRAPVGARAHAVRARQGRDADARQRRRRAGGGSAGPGGGGGVHGARGRGHRRAAGQPADAVAGRRGGDPGRGPDLPGAGDRRGPPAGRRHLLDRRRGAGAQPRLGAGGADGARRALLQARAPARRAGVRRLQRRQAHGSIQARAGRARRQASGCGGGPGAGRRRRPMASASRTAIR